MNREEVDSVLSARLGKIEDRMMNMRHELGNKRQEWMKVCDKLKDERAVFPFLLSCIRDKHLNESLIDHGQYFQAIGGNHGSKLAREDFSCLWCLVLIPCSMCSTEATNFSCV